MASHEVLLAFVQAATQGSFSAAARKLGRSQSTISAAVASLEIDLNLVLFDRSSRKPSLTPAGHVMLQRAEEILDATSRLEMTASQLSQGVEAKLTVAISDTYQSDRFEAALSAFEQRYPDLELECLIAECDDSSTLPNPRPDGPEFVRALQGVMAQNWKKSLLFKDYGDYFYDTFSVTPQRIAGLNSHLIQRMSHATTLSFKDDHGSWFETPLSSIKKWTDINGVGNFDLAPGEIATHSEEINGRVKFMGTFLSTIPFARKYGVLESPLELWIENSTIRKIATDVPGLEHDFNKYLDANPSNRRIEE